jgi:hypothetical protein
MVVVVAPAIVDVVAPSTVVVTAAAVVVAVSPRNEHEAANTVTIRSIAARSTVRSNVRGFNERESGPEAQRSAPFPERRLR